MKKFYGNMKEKIVNTQVWKSIFRHGYPDNDTNKSLAIFTNVFLHLHPVKVRKGALDVRYAWCLGGITFLFFLFLSITGLFLMFYYVPDVRRAYNDIKDLQNVVFFGNLIRNVHRWSAQLMVFFVWLHMIRVFLTGSYKAPREFNWVVGVLLLVLTMVLSWTGYLLPWDQLALWAVTVGTKMAEAAPIIGFEGPFSQQFFGVTPSTDVKFMLLGGTVVGQSALIRFYILHCVALPIAAAIFMAVHFWRVRKDGFSGPL